MRVSTPRKPERSPFMASKMAKNGVLERTVEIESKIDSAGLLVLGIPKGTEYTNEETKLEITWTDEEKILRMNYIIKNGARGLLLAEFDDTHIPEKRFVVNEGIDGFIFSSDQNGSSYLFGKFSEHNGQMEIVDESWMPGMKTLYATRITNFYIDKIITGALEL
jgi:hypothetical protein